MQAAFLIKNGSAESAFELREAPQPEPQAHEVLIKVEGFGLNFADVMARLGMYPDAPPKPGILGYDVVGRIEKVGEEVNTLAPGDRVTALTRFGGYAEYAVTDARAAAKISEDMDPGVALALTTQYGTAYYMAEEMVRMFEGDHVLIHAAAGGVGTALVQLARYRKCVIYGTAGSEKKLDYLRAQGVDHPINYRKEDFETRIRGLRTEGLDIIFDPVGGKSVKKGFRLLGSGGRLVTFGASSMTGAKNIFAKIRVGLGFGFYHPVAMLSNSKAIIGVNMLRIADNRPDSLGRVLREVVRLTEDGILKPTVGGVFPVAKIAEAHAFLESRQSIGKIVVMFP